tara:strand:- start:96 stop:344 length:249 start_codon:yes stop_codon:yes gene_type:complete
MQKLILLLLFLTFSFKANAYIGPGMGGGLIAASLGIIVAIISLIFGIIWFPLKRFFKKKKKKKKSMNDDNSFNTCSNNNFIH